MARGRRPPRPGSPPKPGRAPRHAAVRKELPAGAQRRGEAGRLPRPPSKSPGRFAEREPRGRGPADLACFSRALVPPAGPGRWAPVGPGAPAEGKRALGAEILMHLDRLPKGVGGRDSSASWGETPPPHITAGQSGPRASKDLRGAAVGSRVSEGTRVSGRPRTGPLVPHVPLPWPNVGHLPTLCAPGDGQEPHTGPGVPGGSPPRPHLLGAHPKGGTCLPHPSRHGRPRSPAGPISVKEQTKRDRLSPRRAGERSELGAGGAGGAREGRAVPGARRGQGRGAKLKAPRRGARAAGGGPRTRPCPGRGDQSARRPRY